MEQISTERKKIHIIKEALSSFSKLNNIQINKGVLLTTCTILMNFLPDDVSIIEVVEDNKKYKIQLRNISIELDNKDQHTISIKDAENNIDIKIDHVNGKGRIWGTIQPNRIVPEAIEFKALYNDDLLNTSNYRIKIREYDDRIKHINPSNQWIGNFYNYKFYLGDYDKSIIEACNSISYCSPTPEWYFIECQSPFQLLVPFIPHLTQKELEKDTLKNEFPRLYQTADKRFKEYRRTKLCSIDRLAEKVIARISPIELDNLCVSSHIEHSVKKEYIVISYDIYNEVVLINENGIPKEGKWTQYGENFFEEKGQYIIRARKEKDYGMVLIRGSFSREDSDKEYDRIGFKLLSEEDGIFVRIDIEDKPLSNKIEKLSNIYIHTATVVVETDDNSEYPAVYQTIVLDDLNAIEQIEEAISKGNNLKNPYNQMVWPAIKDILKDSIQALTNKAAKTRRREIDGEQMS